MIKRFLLFGFLMLTLGVRAANPSFNDMATVGVMPFGAWADGIHDDTAAIQAAINRASSLGVVNGYLLFPAGTYKLSSTLVVPPTGFTTFGVRGTNSGLTIRGAGQSRTILDFSSIGGGIGLALTNEGYEGVMISDLTLKGPQDPAAGSVGIAFGNPNAANGSIIATSSPWEGQNNSIERCGVYGFNTGITATNQWNFMVKGCNVSSNYNGGIFFWGTHGCHVQDTLFLNGVGVPGGIGVGFVGTGIPNPGDEGRIENCKFFFFTNAVFNNEVNLIISDCHMEDCNLYYSSTQGSGYPGLTWVGGYIREGQANLTALYGTTVNAALTQFPRLHAYRVAFDNPVFDNSNTGRGLCNLITDGTALIWPYVFAPWAGFNFKAFADTTNSYLAPISFINQTVYRGTFSGAQVVTTYNNNFTGWLGGIFTTGTNDMWLDSLGLWCEFGFTNMTHRMMVLNYSDLTTNGFVDLPTPAVTKSYVYGPCSIHLRAGTTNVLVFNAVNNGDFWGQLMQPTLADTNITRLWACFSATTTSFPFGSTNRTYGPVNFTYRLGNGTYTATAIEAGTSISALTPFWPNSTGTFSNINVQGSTIFLGGNGIYQSNVVTMINAALSPWLADPSAAVDSMAFIQAALDAATNSVGTVAGLGGRTVFLPSGKYTISGTLHQRPYTRILGESTSFGVGTRLAKTTAGICLQLDAPGSQNIEHIRIEMGSTAAGNIGIATQINGSPVKNIKFEDVEVTTCDSGIFLNNAWDIDMISCYGTACNNSLFVSNTINTLKVIGGHWDGTESGIKIIGDFCQGIEIDTTIENSLFGIQCTNTINGGVHSLNIHDGYFEGNTTHIFLSGNPDAIYNASVRSCTFSTGSTNRVWRDVFGAQDYFNDQNNAIAPYNVYGITRFLDYKVGYVPPSAVAPVDATVNRAMFYGGNANSVGGGSNQVVRGGNVITIGGGVAAAYQITGTNGISSNATNYLTALNSAGFTNDVAHSWGTNNMIVHMVAIGETVAFYNRSGNQGQTSCGILLGTDTGVTIQNYQVPVNCGIALSVGTLTSGYVFAQ